MYNLIKVNKKKEEHIENLYFLLEKRQFNISNTEKVNFNDHINFLNNNPYRNWFLVEKNKKLIGSVYTTYGNEIGVNLINADEDEYIYIIKEIIKKYKPLKEKKSIRNENFVINVDPNNTYLLKALKKMGMKLIQNTFLLKQ